VGALRVFLEASSSLSRVYTMTDLPVLREVCHAIFGWDVLLSLTVNPGRSRRFLLLGETGVGKEKMSRLIGRTVRRLHGKEGGEDWRVSATNFGGDTLRSEVFGHKAGAFTGANVGHRGILGSMTDGDYLFIDEIGEASLGMQQVLLRAIQEHEYRPVGETKPRTLRFHLVAATNRSEWSLRGGDGFRSDLYYRLASPQLELPPLREVLREARRPARIFKEVVSQVLAEELELDGRQEALGSLKIMQLGGYLAEATEATKYTWPGNFRELRNTIQQLIYTGADAARTTEILRRVKGGQGVDEATVEASRTLETSERPPTLAELKRTAYERACSRHTTVTAVAKELDVSRQTAHERIKSYGLQLQRR